MMKIAAASYPLHKIDHFDAYASKITRWVQSAADAGADLAVFPEYAAVELAGIGDRAGSLNGAAHGTSDWMDRAVGLHQRLARSLDIHILMGSGPVWQTDHFVNRAFFIAPSGDVRLQDKRITTRFEREDWVIKAGSPLQVFETDLGKIGVLICYDVEFPLLGRALIEAGIEILLVPSSTGTFAGYSRVKIGAMARALEGQCVVVHSVTQGSADWCSVAEENVGTAGIYGPPDLGFPETGILAIGSMDFAGWTYAEVDLSAVRNVRENGRVLNLAHWTEQFGHANTPVQVTLR